MRLTFGVGRGEVSDAGGADEAQGACRQFKSFQSFK